MADYLDVTLYDVMDEPAEVSFTTEGDKAVPTTVVSCDEDGDGFATVYRIQLADLEKA